MNEQWDWLTPSVCCYVLTVVIIRCPNLISFTLALHYSQERKLLAGMRAIFAFTFRDG